MGFYRISPSCILDIETSEFPRGLFFDGRNLANVLAVLRNSSSVTKKRPEEFLRVVMPTLKRLSVEPVLRGSEVGPQLLKLATTYRSDVPIGVVFAKREFEAWFLASAESVGGRCGLRGNLESPPDPEQIRDAKGWLRDRMPPTRTYAATTDQLELTRNFDLTLTRRRSASFDKCYREIERLLRLLAPVSPHGHSAC